MSEKNITKFGILVKKWKVGLLGNLNIFCGMGMDNKQFVNNVKY